MSYLDEERTITFPGGISEVWSTTLRTEIEKYINEDPSRKVIPEVVISKILNPIFEASWHERSTDKLYTIANEIKDEILTLNLENDTKESIYIIIDNILKVHVDTIDNVNKHTRTNS